MGYLGIAEKLTNAPQPTIAINKKLTSAEFNQLRTEFNANYELILDNAAAISLLSPTPYIRKNVDFTISSPGVYVFFGSTQRTFTINNAIDGVIEIRIIASVDLLLSATLNSGHLGTIYAGSSVTFLRWDSVDLEYNF